MPVALRVSAWIENLAVLPQCAQYRVALRVSAWIETFAAGGHQRRNLSRPA